MKFLVTFTQVSHHKVGAIVEAESMDEATKKARIGDSIAEYNITEPESWELRAFNARAITEFESAEWIALRKMENNE